MIYTHKNNQKNNNLSCCAAALFLPNAPPCCCSSCPTPLVLQPAAPPALTQEMRDGNVELKETIKNHDGMKALYVENLMQLERTLEKNAHLERSLSAATTEVAGLRENKVALEESCKHLSSEISGHQSERAMFIARIEGISHTMEKLSEKNVFLENLLSENNTELEIHRRKLKDLEESAQALRNQNSVLRSDKNCWKLTTQS